MIDDVSDIAAYYDNNPDGEHDRLDRHQLEYDLTWRFLDRYLPLRGSILEIGAATGRYTLPLAKQGYAVTAVDMSAVLLEQNRKNLAAARLGEQVRWVKADARDLSEVAEKEFDALLLMGPLYHLVEEADRKQALKEAFDRLREGGIFFSSFISRFGIMGDLLRKVPDWIEDQGEVRSVLEKGRDPIAAHPGQFRGYFALASEIPSLHEAVGFETVLLAGVEPAISADDESYNKLAGEQRRLWLDLLFEISTEPSIIGASRHLLYVGRKGLS
jgi:S-adenosylmethionine-dependent methyltransferase